MHLYPDLHLSLEEWFGAGFMPLIGREEVSNSAGSSTAIQSYHNLACYVLFPFFVFVGLTIESSSPPHF
jgi:hypothetical protein